MHLRGQHLVTHTDGGRWWCIDKSLVFPEGLFEQDNGNNECGQYSNDDQRAFEDKANNFIRRLGAIIAIHDHTVRDCSL